MSADRADGLAAAVAGALDATGPALPVRGATAEQLALLPETGRLERAQVEAMPRGRGRPRGSANRRTVAWRDYLTSQYTHPLETLAAIQSTPVDVLAAQLGCKPIEALAVIKSAAAELAPYLEGKQPVAVDLNVRSDLGLLVIEGLTHTADEVAELIEGDFLSRDDLPPEMAEISHSSGSGGEPLE